jgi:hypothetical protein
MNRDANMRLVKSVPRKLWDNYGVHQERGKESVSRIISMVAGHDLNHLKQIERILKPKKLDLQIGAFTKAHKY